MTHVPEPVDGVQPPARWRARLALALSLLGLAIATYLTITHFSKAPLVCSDSGPINCQKVTTSAQSYFLHIPVAVLGLAFYVAVTACNLPAAWRSADRRIHMARLALLGLGMCFALYLVSAELLIIGAICIWCTAVHVVTFALFVLVVQTVPAMLGWGQRESAGAASGGAGRRGEHSGNGRPASDRLPRSARR
ncbi:MAG TPA: vitamin K epoxide reductase family protein [Acidimicrobiales bacterium]|nr:vitamin K epoxide reductase family protein [Acidimicrobiales bacterium]